MGKSLLLPRKIIKIKTYAKTHKNRSTPNTINSNNMRRRMQKTQ
jgi:hypothetical protein